MTLVGNIDVVVWVVVEKGISFNLYQWLQLGESALLFGS